ncbi:esterase/lipase family protein [Sulfitobacter aestuariivivens]|uniref:esterase/lipase family protein n=1 Tax=Sulfitobacter aestuariivivens TaxID=2766981 RepID=UPI00360C680E
MAEATSIAPRKALLLMEGRAIPELFGFAAALPTLSLLAPRGDGQPVLVLPGLTTNDTSTIAMRRFLKSKGYPTYGWKMGLNLGPRPGVERGLIDLVEGLHEEHGRKVSIVGWSLGGIYARQLGKMMPDKIRQVISMGSPFGGSPRATNAWRVYEMASGQSSHDGERHMGGAISAPRRCRPPPSTARQTASALGKTASRRIQKSPRTSKSKAVTVAWVIIRRRSMPWRIGLPNRKVTGSISTVPGLRACSIPNLSTRTDSCGFLKFSKENPRPI